MRVAQGFESGSGGCDAALGATPGGGKGTHHRGVCVCSMNVHISIQAISIFCLWLS